MEYLFYCFTQVYHSVQTQQIPGPVAEYSQVPSPIQGPSPIGPSVRCQIDLCLV